MCWEGDNMEDGFSESNWQDDRAWLEASVTLTS